MDMLAYCVIDGSIHAVAGIHVNAYLQSAHFNEHLQGHTFA